MKRQVHCTNLKWLTYLPRTCIWVLESRTEVGRSLSLNWIFTHLPAASFLSRKLKCAGEDQENRWKRALMMAWDVQSQFVLQMSDASRIFCYQKPGGWTANIMFPERKWSANEKSIRLLAVQSYDLWQENGSTLGVDSENAKCLGMQFTIFYLFDFPPAFLL